MLRRLSIILLAALISYQALFGGMSSAIAICLGGGRQHELVDKPTEAAEACEHADGSPWLASTEDHQPDCGCIDIKLGLIETLDLPRSQSGSPLLLSVQSAPAWVVTELGHGLSWTGPPALPLLWFGLGGTQRLMIISSTRLLL